MRGSKTVGKDRIKRPEPSRTQPFRNLSTLLGAPPHRNGEGGARAREQTASGSIGEAVSRSVALGYRVVDEYIRQGQRAAQRLNDRSLGPETITRDVQDLTTRMAQYASDFLGVWFEVIELATVGGNGHRNGNHADTPPVAPPIPRPLRDTAAERTRVRIAVASAQPAEVALDLAPDADRRTLVVHALRAVDPDKPRLADVRLVAGEPGEPLTLHVKVPDGHPAGVYNGLIIDA
jgi:hypothetical protein